MTTKLKSPRRQGSRASYIIGRDTFARISEAEGIRTSREQDEEFQRFDREGLSAEARRHAIVRKYSRKS